MKVAVGLSGGVDSSVAAALLKEEGYDLIALFMQNWHETTGTLYGDCHWEEDRAVAEMVAKKLDIPFHFIDLSGPYRERVVDYMFREYEAGRTPNPDVLCNREIKFDLFLKGAEELGAEMVATGHYARIASLLNEVGQKEFQLLKGVDSSKDQSYFLCQLSQEQLSKALFPIGGIKKERVRELAREFDLPTAEKKDSQGICFVGKIDLPLFLQQKLESKSGKVVEIDRTFYSQQEERQSEEELKSLATPYSYTLLSGRVIGDHNGAHFYTIGQRRGLNIGGYREPLFVLATDVEENLIFVGEGGDHPGLFRRAIMLDESQLHWVAPSFALDEGESLEVEASVRYRQKPQKGTLYFKEGRHYLLFDQPQRAVAPGQFAVWYVGELLVGSAPIE